MLWQFQIAEQRHHTGTPVTEMHPLSSSFLFMTHTTVMVVDALTPYRPIEQIVENFRGQIGFLGTQLVDIA
jgi:hypothetical protein